MRSQDSVQGKVAVLAVTPTSGAQHRGAATQLPLARNVTLPTPRNLFKTLLKIVCNTTARGEHDRDWSVVWTCSPPIGCWGIVTENVALLNYASLHPAYV